jgi:hypothetical protein
MYMNKNTIATMLRLNKVEDVVAIVLALPEAKLEATLETTVAMHNENPSPVSEAFLMAILEKRPQNVRVA